MIRILLALLLFVLVYGGAVAIALRLRPRPLALAPPLALAILVAYEGVVLPAISQVRGVTPLGLVVAHLPLMAAAVLGLAGGRGAATLRRALWGAMPPRAIALALLPLAALLLFGALRQPPTTWDSMTYHLARVAHWLQNGSVLTYATWIQRQNLFPPGAEYLLLVPQVLTGTDRLAGLVQLFCWGIAVLSAPALARRFGVPRRLAPAAAVAVATLPMGVLQATSTQNDLVAAVAAIAAVAAALPLAHARRPRPEQGVALGIALAAAWLVKPTALVAVAPFLAWAALAGLRGPWRPAASRLLAWAGPAAVPALLLLGAEAMRRQPYGFPQIEGFYYYPLVGEWIDRAAHSVRAVAHHLPISEPLARLSGHLVSPTGAGFGPGAQPFRPNEDYAGNAMHAALFLVALAIGAARWPALPGRARAGLLAPAAGWILLHALARENSWFSRLELPLFALAVTALGVLHGLASAAGSSTERRLKAVAVPVAAFALLVAAANEHKPIWLPPPEAEAAYYVARPAVKLLDDGALAAARESSCRRLGVRFASQAYDDPWEYPLAWRARREGIEVEHVQGGEDWPCLVFSPGSPPDPAAHGRWVPVPGTEAWRRAP
jgi:hypothetical protein